MNFENRVSEDWWQDLVLRFQLQSIKSAEMTNQLLGEKQIVDDPPNLLAQTKTDLSNSWLVIRCSRMYFNGGVDAVAEISFEGAGAESQTRIEGIAAYLNAQVVFDS